MEGMLWSIVDLLNVVSLDNFKLYWTDPEYAYKRVNFFAALQDLLLMLIIYWCIKAMYPDKKPSNIDNFLERNLVTVLNNSAQDVNPW
ncbi:MAG: hypothetical protein Nk1A_8330 [Endomicrobiia bacterium]|nr:MAG: hypothetical protein Nk1A_8330 [Endomicrobiia bacterium]